MSKVWMIAGAGVNHNDSLETAKRLVDVAREAGADVVKFQTFRADSLASQYAQKAEYQLHTTDGKETQKEMVIIPARSESKALMREERNAFKKH